MTTDRTYTVVIRCTSHDGPSSTITRTVRARHGDEAQGKALYLAARLSNDRGREYRVARVDPA